MAYVVNLEVLSYATLVKQSFSLPYRAETKTQPSCKVAFYRIGVHRQTPSRLKPIAFAFFVQQKSATGCIQTRPTVVKDIETIKSLQP